MGDRVSDKWIFLLVSAVAFSLFILSPVRQLGDSQYSLLVTQSLLQHGSFAVDQYDLAIQAADFTNRVSIRKGLPYQLQFRRKRIYYYYPPGTSVLSLPFVAIAIPLHRAPAENGVYSKAREQRLQSITASALMGLLAGFVYLTARLLLGRPSSIVLTVAATMGTMVWSTASRGLPSHTWGILLLTMAIYLVLKLRLGQSTGTAAEILLATLLSCSYIVRPTFALSAVAVFVYLILLKRRVPIAYLVTGAGWLLLFVVYSQAHFDQWLPNYYRAGKMHFGLGYSFWWALAGALFSPSRGLLVFVPTLAVCFYLCLRYRRFLTQPDLAILSATVLFAHAILVASAPFWWGGYSYGPRLFTDVLPWAFLLGALGIRARGDALHAKLSRRPLELAVMLLILFAAIFMHGVGAWSIKAGQWNKQPVDINIEPDRVWDWRHPQFLAPVE